MTRGAGTDEFGCAERPGNFFPEGYAAAKKSVSADFCSVVKKVSGLRQY